ncbi:MAG: sugar phosphate isomerase/epimerase family protein [Armatimonadota bacterium]
MQIACSSWSFHREIPRNLQLLDFPAWCSSQGISAIEMVDTQLPSVGKAYLDELKRALSRSDTSLVCLAVNNDFTLPDANQLFSQVERVRHLLYDVAAPLKIPIMRVLIGMSDTTPAGDQRALETFRGMVVDLETTGVSMALENHARVQTHPDQTAAIIAGVNSPYFGSCVDFGSLPSGNRYEAIDSLAPLAKIVHARTCDFDGNGEETTMNYKEYLSLLAEVGYDGIISIDYEGRGEPSEGVLKTKALIEKYWYNPAAQPGQMAA